MPVVSFTPRCQAGLVFILMLSATAAFPGAPAASPPASPDVLIERGYLPEAKPNAFAIGFSNGVGFCYDPVRGGLNYVWTGGFVDATPIRPGMGKNLGPVTLPGPVVFRERGEAPLRIGDPTRKAETRLVGYELGEDRIEFIYTVGDVEVREQIRPRDGGGLVRHFRLSRASGPVWYLPGATEGAEISVRAGVPDAGGFRVADGAVNEFTVEIVFPEARR